MGNTEFFTSDRVRRLSIALGDVETFSDRELSSQQADEFKEIANGCREVLETLEKTLNKYSELQPGCEDVRKKVKKMWKRLKWEPDDIRDLRDRMITSVALLNAFHGRLAR